LTVGFIHFRYCKFFKCSDCLRRSFLLRNSNFTVQVGWHEIIPLFLKKRTPHNHLLLQL
jgi:hypothetical protein